MSDYPEIVLVARSPDAADLVQQYADGKIPFAGPGSIWEEFNRRGWSTLSLYEVCRSVKP